MYIIASVYHVEGIVTQTDVDTDRVPALSSNQRVIRGKAPNRLSVSMVPIKWRLYNNLMASIRVENIDVPAVASATRVGRGVRSS